MLTQRRRSWRSTALWIVCLGLIATSVSGCVIEPWHPWHAHPYGYRY
jgi:hypothetical protein